jgi:hypothetical protein
MIKEIQTKVSTKNETERKGKKKERTTRIRKYQQLPTQQSKGKQKKNEREHDMNTTKYQQRKRQKRNKKEQGKTNESINNEEDRKGERKKKKENNFRWKQIDINTQPRQVKGITLQEKKPNQTENTVVTLERDRYTSTLSTDSQDKTQIQRYQPRKQVQSTTHVDSYRRSTLGTEYSDSSHTTMRKSTEIRFMRWNERQQPEDEPSHHKHQQIRKNAGWTSVDRSTKATLNTYNTQIQLSRLQKIYHPHRVKLQFAATISFTGHDSQSMQQGHSLALVM